MVSIVNTQYAVGVSCMQVNNASMLQTDSSGRKGEQGRRMESKVKIMVD